ncbi:hypothetical protein CRYUN_Cryun03dG0065000 [Craigia yunnanensis]
MNWLIQKLRDSSVTVRCGKLRTVNPAKENPWMDEIQKFPVGVPGCYERSYTFNQLKRQNMPQKAKRVSLSPSIGKWLLKLSRPVQ